MKEFDNRNGDGDAWVIAHDDTEVFHIAPVRVGNIASTGQDNLNVYIPTYKEWEENLEKVIDLYSQAESSSLPIPLPEFLKTNLDSVVSFVNNDSSDLIDTFKKSEEEWLDMRVSPDQPSPREVALAMLS